MAVQPKDLILLMMCRPDRAIAIAYWHLTRRRLRARYRLAQAITDLPFAYQRWVRDSGMADLQQLAVEGAPSSSARSETGHGTRPLYVHLHIGPGTPEADVRRAITSVLHQGFPEWRLLVTAHDNMAPPLPNDHRIRFLEGPDETTADGLANALKTINAESGGGDATQAYLVPLATDCILPRYALAAYAAHMPSGAGHDMPILYGDQDEFGDQGFGANPWLKPQWDAQMFLSQDYVTAACALPVAASAARMAEANRRPESPFELVLRMTGEDDIPAHHVPRITARTPSDHWRRPSPNRIAALARWLASESGTRVTAGPHGTASIQWRLPEPPPKISIIVPTRDQVELLRTCVGGLLERTNYPDFEIIIADNGSVEPETLRYLRTVADDERVRVVNWPHAFNYSAINNYAAGFAKGRFLCLLNNDIEIIAPDWLCELVRHGTRPGVGATGARLLYPDRSIQHAGVVIGMGNAAGHAHRGLPEGEPGYFAQALIARGASAVTGACLVVRKAHFEAVGGLDEEGLAVAYNDVDLCLKLERAGLRNVYVPSAVLIHHESKSRGLDFAPEHLARYMRELAVFQERWGSPDYQDPWHHPGLDRSSEVYKVKL
ncbi:glycosyltransferase family 2 protein [Sphingomonas sp. KC8]|uniref:glycosyltransferase family 2 protein n=1 Tax=Sphingomonas sp. KC8 TaxID=1030157 RepID=UPI000248B215|nr:glycosyltransferase family 2 protein [Sphingomonas sp. KC8]ARS28392.1 Glycosyl transferase, family 2 [Sphingomonas sp. KC8]